MSIPHLLIESSGVTLLDTGFPGDDRRIRREITRLGFGPEDVRAIVLTHGHIDHAGNVAALKDWSGAPIYAHRLDQQHLDGVFPYAGASRICGALETVGRAATRYRRACIDVHVEDRMELPYWGGLRVIHLPGHTVGHCGYYSVRHDLLFTGDLWVRFMMRTQISPPIFTDQPRLVWPSMLKARAIGARWIVPGHYDQPNATCLRRRFEELCDEHERRKTACVV